jgi:hypothetical protein
MCVCGEKGWREGVEGRRGEKGCKEQERGKGTQWRKGCIE